MRGNDWKPVYRPGWTILWLVLCVYALIAVVVREIVTREPRKGNAFVEVEK
jgi:hypothetical protein